MRLAIINITAGGISGGYRKYLLNMLPRLSENPKIEDIVCAYPRGMDIHLWFNEQLRIHYCPFGLTLGGYSMHRKGLELQKCIESFSPDIIFLPAARYFKYRNVPVVNMLQNMEPFVPGISGDALRDVLKKYLLRKIGIRAIRKADHTIAISSYVKEFITSVTGEDPDNVSLIYHGLSKQDGVRKAVKPSSFPSAWEERFLFTAGSIRPARGLGDLIEALHILKVRGHDLRLLIAGDWSSSSGRYRRTIEKRILALGLADHIHWAGTLNNEEMRWCYQTCDFFIMTSRVEACPNIALEALSCGAMIASSDNPPLPEIFSQCASYYQSGDGASLAETVINLGSANLSERFRLAEQARQRSSLFSWDLTADETVSAFERVLENARMPLGRTKCG